MGKILPDALQSTPSLLCTATNATPHERLFNFQRRSANGSSMPSWLMQPGTVLMKRNVSRSKYELLVDEVELVEANSHYAHVKFPDGRETTVSTKQLAPTGNTTDSQTPSIEMSTSEVPTNLKEEQVTSHDDSLNDNDTLAVEEIPLRRSTRTRRPPERLDL